MRTSLPPLLSSSLGVFDRLCLLFRGLVKFCRLRDSDPQSQFLAGTPRPAAGIQADSQLLDLRAVASQDTEGTMTTAERTRPGGLALSGVGSEPAPHDAGGGPSRACRHAPACFGHLTSYHSAPALLACLLSANFFCKNRNVNI